MIAGGGGRRSASGLRRWPRAAPPPHALISSVMAMRTDTFDLGGLRLTSGEGRRLDLDVAIDPFSSAGSSTRWSPRWSPSGWTSPAPPATATCCGSASRRSSSGPCMRCLEPAAPTFEVDAREVSQPGEARRPVLAVRPRRDPRPAGVGARRARARAPDRAAVPARTAPGSVPSAARTSTRPVPTTLTSARRIHAGRSCRRSASTSGGDAHARRPA